MPGDSTYMIEGLQDVEQDLNFGMKKNFSLETPGRQSKSQVSLGDSKAS